MLFFCDLFQTDLIVTVPSGDDHKIRVHTPLHLIKCFFEGFTDDTGRTGTSCVIRKHRAVFQHSHFAADHPSDLNDRYGHMTAAADNDLLFPTQGITKHPVSGNLCHTTLGDGCCRSPVLRKKSLRIALPDESSIREQCLFTQMFFVKRREHKTDGTRFTCFYLFK